MKKTILVSSLLVWAMLGTASAMPAMTTIFSEDFGNGGTDSSMGAGWSDGGNFGADAERRASGSGNDTASPNGGRFAVMFGDSGWICRSVTATGYSNVSLSYYWRGDGDANSSSDNAYVEIKPASGHSCSDGTGWTQLKNHDMRLDSSWWTQSAFTDAGMNNTTFLLRFRTSTSQNDEHFRVDGILVEGTAAANVAPVAHDMSLTIDEDVATTTVLDVTDANSDPLTYTIVASPVHGTLSGTAPNLVYTPEANYFGSDSFTFKGNDGTSDSNTATVSITITSVNDAPVITFVGPGHFLTTLNYPTSSIPLGATASDVEDGDLTPSIVRTGEPVTSSLGIHTINYLVVDSGNATTSVDRVIEVLAPLGGSGGTNGTPGCKDPKASNYDPSAVYDGTCTYAPAGEVLGASTSTLPGEVLGASTTTPVALQETTPQFCSSPFLNLGRNALGFGRKNDSSLVKAIQEYLNKTLGLSIPVTGYFGPKTVAAVRQYQDMYKNEILSPWSVSVPTGIVYITTMRHINKTLCPGNTFDLKPEELVPASR